MCKKQSKKQDIIINTNLREKDLNMHGLANLPKLDTAAHASTQKNHP